MQKASIALDGEKQVAESEFKKLLEKIQQIAAKARDIEKLCMEESESYWKQIRSWFRSLGGSDDLREHCNKRGRFEKVLPKMHVNTEFDDRELDSYDEEHHGELDFLLPSEHSHSGRPFGHFRKDGTIRKFIKAAKRVQAVNKKLSSFERGFISKEGIKDREWYKHLGVAPGKYLGEFRHDTFNISLVINGLTS